MYTGSHSMFSECLHSLADTVNQLILAYGIHKSSQVCSLSSYPFYYLYTYGREVIYFIIINNMLYLCHINHVHSKCPLSTTIPPKQKKTTNKETCNSVTFLNLLYSNQIPTTLMGTPICVTLHLQCLELVYFVQELAYLFTMELLVIIYKSQVYI